MTAFAPELLAWTEHTRRDLPWRRTRDPWAILVSELMLQQTQVARVVPKYETFLARFPTPADCAAAPQSEIVRLWAGLGYNRRAVNLHRCAQAVVADHDGRLPADLTALLALPGIGPYTARAVLAFAFAHDVAVVDTNVGRILARRAGRTLAPAEVQTMADELVPDGRGWEWNQAMLDLGATVCTKRSPGCDRCPVTEGCAWGHHGGDDPATGSAAVSGPQSRFAGSDRQGRGRLIEALRSGPVATRDLAEAMGWPGDAARAQRVAETLVRDELIRVEGPSITLA